MKRWLALFWVWVALVGFPLLIDYGLSLAGFGRAQPEEVRGLALGVAMTLVLVRELLWEDMRL